MARWRGNKNQKPGQALGLEGTEVVLLSTTWLPIWAKEMGETTAQCRGIKLPCALSPWFPRSNCLAVISFNDIMPA